MHFPWGHPRRPLAVILPCGARTFLMQKSTRLFSPLNKRYFSAFLKSRQEGGGVIKKPTIHRMVGKNKKSTAYWLCPLHCVGAFLFSRAASSQVFSAQVSLTAVFGMGTGVPSPPSTPTVVLFRGRVILYHTVFKKSSLFFNFFEFFYFFYKKRFFRKKVLTIVASRGIIRLAFCIWECSRVAKGGRL